MVSPEYANLLIALNQSSACVMTQTMVQDLKEKVLKEEVIRVPYNSSLLRLNHNQMVCLGKHVNSLRSAYYNQSGVVSRKKLDEARKLCGCKQLCTIVT